MPNHPANDDSPETRIARVAQNHPEYAHEAYRYIANAVHVIAQEIQEQEAESDPHAAKRHISIAELLDGLRTHLLKDFGRLAFDILGAWHVHTTADFGNIVYNLVEGGVLSLSPEDSIADFYNQYSFHKAFVAPFQYPNGDQASPWPVIDILRKP